MFHAVVGQGACPEVVSEGVEYISLAERTGGSIGELCRGDFASLFEGLTAGALDASNGCVYPLDPSSDWYDEPHLVAIEAAGMKLDSLGAPEECTQFGHGWFLDDTAEPTTLHLCPASCGLIQFPEPPILEISIICEIIER